MTQLTDFQLWLYRGVFVLAGLVAILLPLLPSGLTADAISMPDLFLCLVIAWVIRSPDTAPFFLVFAMALLADVMLNRPIGLWAFLTLAGAEYMRATARTMREHMFLVETLIFGAALVAMSLAHLLVLNLALVTTPRIGLVASHLGVTILAYPVIVAILHWIIGIRAPRLPSASTRLGPIR